MGDLQDGIREGLTVKRRLAVAAALLGVAIWLGWVLFSPGRATVAVEGEDADIYEAVFRHLLATNAANGWPGNGTFFISIQDMDPPDAFLERLLGDWPGLRKGSRFALGRGIVLSASAITQLPNGRVQVIGGERIHTRPP
jgi:hypothetical protein